MERYRPAITSAPESPEPRERDDRSDDAAEIRYSLTALGEAFVADRSGARFRGFGPCSVATLRIAG